MSRGNSKLKRKEVGTSNPARVFWTREHDKVLIDLMLEQTIAGSRIGAGFARAAWTAMLDKFNERTRLQYDVEHLKNRFKYYRREFRVVNGIKNHPGFRWDQKSQIVVTDDAEWDLYVSKKPEAKLYKTRQTPFFHELAIICGESVSKGNEASSSKIPDDEGYDANASLLEGDGTLNSLVMTPEMTNCPVSASDDTHAKSQQDIQESQNMNGHQTSPSISLRECGNKSRLQTNDVLLALREIAEASKRQTSMRVETPDRKYDLLDNCLEELNLIKEIDNELYVKVLLILKEEHNQHIFLKTAGVRRLMWLKAVTKDIDLS